VCLIVSIAAYEPTLTGSAWQSQTSEQKQDVINGDIYADNSSTTWYSAAHLPELFLEDMNVTFDTVADDMPAQFALSTERPKLIHTIGAIAPIQFIPNGTTSYTGFFEGTNTAYIRLSLAAEPTTSPPSITPGLSMKFLRNGVPSANVVAMFSIQGQPSFNFFEHDLSNHPPNLDPSNMTLAQSALFTKFKEASFYPNYIGMNTLATYDQQGNQEPNPLSPFRIIFHPFTNIHEMFPSEPQQGAYYFIPQLESIPAGPLFYLYAQETPTSGFEQIGVIETLAPLSASQYGDLNLFFEHVRMEDDLALHPEWVAGTDELQAEQAGIPYYTWPDLPWN